MLSSWSRTSSRGARTLCCLGGIKEKAWARGGKEWRRSASEAVCEREVGEEASLRIWEEAGRGGGGGGERFNQRSRRTW